MNFNFISSHLSLADKNLLGQIRQYRVKNPLKSKYIESKLAAIILAMDLYLVSVMISIFIAYRIVITNIN